MPPQSEPQEDFQLQQGQVHVLAEQQAQEPIQSNYSGLCNYCRRPGHFRKSCRLFLARQNSPPDTVWCQKCLCKNHREIHCTAKVIKSVCFINTKFVPHSNNANNFKVYKNHFHNKYNQSINKQVNSSQEYSSSHNSYHSNHVKIERRTRNMLDVNIKYAIRQRLLNFHPDFANKVLKVFFENNPKMNHIKCPHLDISSLDNCSSCHLNHPELVRLERAIVSFDPNFLFKQSMAINKNNDKAKVPAHHHDTQVISQNKHLPSDNTVPKINVCVWDKSISVKKIKKRNKVNKNIKKSHKITPKNNAVNNDNLVEEPTLLITPLEKYVSRRHLIKQHNENAQSIVIKSKFSESARALHLDPLIALNNQFNPSWTTQLDENCDNSVKNSTQSVDDGKVICNLVNNDEEFKTGDVSMFNTLHAESYPVVILNKANHITVTHESYNTPWTTKTITQNCFWVNANGKFIKTLVDNGADNGSIRKDLVDKWGLDVIPLKTNEPNFAKGIAGNVEILGKVSINIKFLDIDMGDFVFHINEKSNDDDDQLVLGQDFLTHHELIYYGDQRVLQGYLPNGLCWSYQSKPNSVRRIISDIRCSTVNAFEIPANESQTVEVKFDIPSYLVNLDIACNIPNFSYGTQTNLIRPLNIIDRRFEKKKYPINHYLASPKNFYHLDISQPKFKIINSSKNSLIYESHDLVGKAYSIKEIHMNNESHVNVPDTDNKFKLISEDINMPVDMPNELQDCIFKTNINVSSNFTSELLSQDVFKQNEYYDEIEVTLQTSDLPSIPDDPMLSDFNPPDEFDLKDVSEWTKESLRESVKIGDNCPISITDDFHELMYKYKDTVSNSTVVAPSLLPEVHLIKKSNKIVNVPQYKVNPITATEVQSIVQNLLEQGIVEPSSSLYNSPVHLVRKKDGSGRLCIDLRQVNNELETPVPSPLPSIDDIMSELHGMKVFSCLDMLSGFLQCNLAKDSRPLTAFTSVHRYQYVRLPFGCSQSPIIFAQLLNTALADMLAPICLKEDNGVARQHVRIYIDDICLFSKTYEGHLELLDKLFKLLAMHNLKLKLEKCVFLSESMKFLGFIFNQNTMQKDPKYVEKILSLAKPVFIRDIMRLIGSCVYINKFIKNFSVEARPLTELASTCKQKMKARVIWTPERESAYIKLKELVAEEVKLTYPDMSPEAPPLVIETDASTIGTGAILKQRLHDEEVIIAFLSCTFNKTQKSYSATEIEILGIKAGIRAFKTFLTSKHFIIRSDHAPLMHLLSLKPFNGRIARTLEFLSTYNFSVEWIPGPKNILPDMLSRSFPWELKERDFILDDHIDSYHELPVGISVDKITPGSGDSLLISLLAGERKLNNDSSVLTVGEVNLCREMLFNEIDKHREKYKLKINKDTAQAWTAFKHPHHPLTINFIQAFANLKNINVLMYFGLEYPIIFKAPKTLDLEPQIIIQSIANHHFNLLKKDPNLDTSCHEFKHKQFLKFSSCHLWGVLLDNINPKKQETYNDFIAEFLPNNLEAYNEINALPDIQVFNDFYHNRQEYIKKVNKEINISLNEESNNNEMLKSDKLDPFLVYEQSSDGTFHTVHPKSYANWYSRCCNHIYSSESYVPASCGTVRFCANLDSGSTTSCLNMSTANKLFDQNKLTKLYDTKTTLHCAGGLTQVVDTRVVTADITIGTGRFRGVKFILLPDEMMFSCAIIGNEVLSSKGVQMDFGTRVVRYRGAIMVELARLKHPRYYNRDCSPPMVGKAVAATPHPYILCKPSLTINQDLLNFVKIKAKQNIDEYSELRLDNFIDSCDLLELQQRNKDLRNLKKVMSFPNYKLPVYLSHYKHIKNKLVVIDEIIYYHCEPRNPVPLLPTQCIITMGLQIHDKYFHAGRDKLTDLMKDIAYHVKLPEILGKITGACVPCQLRKHHPPRHVPPTIKIHTAYPFQMVVTDLLNLPDYGPYKYVLTCVDHFSKYVAALPLKNKTSEAVANAFEKHILPSFVALPQEVLSDRGLEFCSIPFKSVLAKYNIKQKHSASYHAASHGSIEIVNKSLQQSLRMHAETSQDWPSALPHVVMMHNNTRHDSLKTSPAKKILNHAYNVNQKPVLSKQETQYWKVGNPSFKPYKVGALVLKITPRVGNRTHYKLQTLYSGPYAVTKILENKTSYSIRSIDDGTVIPNVHHTQLRTWISPDKILLQNPDFLEYYNYYRPLSHSENLQLAEDLDAVEQRNFNRNWRPSDDPDSVAREDLSDEFFTEECETGSQNDEEEVEEIARPEPIETPQYTIVYSPPAWTSSELPNCSPMPQPNMHNYNKENNNRVPIQSPPKEPQRLNTNYNIPNNIPERPVIIPNPVENVNKIINAHLTNLPQFESQVVPPPSHYSHPISPLTTASPPHNSPPLQFTPSHLQSPPSKSFVHSPPHHTPLSSPESYKLGELFKSPPPHQPSPTAYFKTPYHTPLPLNKSPLNRDKSYTPQFTHETYRNLINEAAALDSNLESPVKNTPFSYSHSSNQLPDQRSQETIKKSPLTQIDSEHQNTRPPSPRYKTFPPHRMETRSQSHNKFVTRYN
ncbi:unnamed protein product [Rotaria socialis]|nr:unnamed protein product [Rotaria socialis]